MKYDEFYEFFYVKKCQVDRSSTQTRNKLSLSKKSEKNRKSFWSLRLHSKKICKAVLPEKTIKGRLKSLKGGKCSKRNKKKIETPLSHLMEVNQEILVWLLEMTDLRNLRNFAKSKIYPNRNDFKARRGRLQSFS